ncbi:alpha/beta fold hydrolase [Demequina pelophila]|uniref:alpha/beta fold hydrolase n=1 Tax=Demequina pelophila TaxID=1638984 RepID=UPI000783EDB7|nr:alpha/beta hydrolase [Demequina pelophila]
MTTTAQIDEPGPQQVAPAAHAPAAPETAEYAAAHHARLARFLPRRPYRDDDHFREVERELWASHGRPDPVERWVTAETFGNRLRVLDHGEGRTVLMVHGIPSAASSLVAMARALDGTRVLAVDRPGCGLSEPIDYGPLDRDQIIGAITSNLAAAAEQLADGPVDVVGASLGGMAALTFAARRPDLVRSVILAGVPSVRGLHLPRDLRLATLEPVGRVVARRWVTRRDFVHVLRAQGHDDLLEAGWLDGAELEWRLALARHTDTFTHEMQLLSRAATWRGVRADWLPGRAELESLQAPSLWWIGDKDPFAGPARVRAWAQHAPRSRVVVQEGTGHQPWNPDPESVGRAIREWWAGVESVAA